MDHHDAPLVEAGFEAVAAAFRETLTDRPGGGALSIWMGGRPVVDLWGGSSDREGHNHWTADTPTVVFSCTKALVSTIAARLVQRGLLDYEAPVVRYWPEFGQAGKQEVLVRHLLAHQAGLSAPRRDVTAQQVTDWEFMTALLAEQAPLWPPGSGHEYHSLTFGWLVGEVIRRITGKPIGAVLDEVIARPLGADIWLGAPSRVLERTAELIPVPAPEPALASAGRRTPAAPEWGVRALTLGGAFPVELFGDGTGFNDPHIRAAEIPGAGGIATAHGLAKAMSALVTPTDGVRLIDDALVERASTPHSEGRPVFGRMPPWSRRGLGFQLDSEGRRYLSAASFGHDGAGGQVAFADPGARIGFAYLTNQMTAGEDHRATAIIEALREVIRPGTHGNAG